MCRTLGAAHGPPDDTILVGTGQGSIYRVPSGGGAVTPVTKWDAGKEGSHRWPHFLPDGRHFLFTIRSEVASQRGIYLGSLDSEARKLLVHSDSNAVYVSPGYLLFLEGGTLFARAFDADRLEVLGQSFTIAGDVGRASNGYGSFSGSRTGAIAYAGSDVKSGRLTWFDRSGATLGSLGPEAYYTDFRLSPDEKRLTASIVDPKTGYPDIWLTDVVRGASSRFTSGPVLNSGAVWSPDGARIIFRTTRRGGSVEFYQKSSAGSGKEEPLLLADVQRAAGGESLNLFTSGFSPDGRNLLYSSTTNAGCELWVLPLNNRKPVRLLRTPGAGVHTGLSPDGRLLAYTSDESGRSEVYVQTFPLSDRSGKSPQTADQNLCGERMVARFSIFPKIAN